MDLQETLKNIKTQFRLGMNGAVSKSMRDKGLDYKLNFGVEIPRLKEIAAQYPKDHQLAQALWKENIRECKRHYCIRISEDEVFQYQKELFRTIQLLPRLREKSWFNIPAYGTDEWANWMIDLHLQRKSKARKGRPKKAPNF